MRYLFSLLAGALLPLAFAPVGWAWLAIICPAILLRTWISGTTRQATGTGLCFGLGMFGVGISWVYISIHQFGGANLWIAGIITALLILCCAITITIQGFAFHTLTRHKHPSMACLCAFPAIWVLIEYLRTWLFTGFPWLLLGDSQTHSILSSWLPIVGTYGTSLILSICSGLLVLITLKQSLMNRLIYLTGGITVVLLSLLLQTMQWTFPSASPLSASLVQGNIHQSLKWDPNRLQSIIDSYDTLTKPHWSSTLIVWPEAAIPATPAIFQPALDRWATLAKAHNSTLILGVPLYNTKEKVYYNALIAVGHGQGQYTKRHLVPFGEYIPLGRFIRPLISSLDIPMSDMRAGPYQQQPITHSDLSMSAFICYEIAYQSLLLDTIDADNNLIVVISDDSWFGHSWAAAQQLQIAQARASSVGRPILYASNTGITAFINASGGIDARAPIDTALVLTHTVMPVHGSTPLMQWRYVTDAAVLILLLLTFIV